MTTRRFRAGIVVGSLLASWPELAGAGSTVALFHPGGSASTPDQGDYISSNVGAGLDSPYRYFIEVTPGLSRLQVDLFDADVGLGGVTAENNANRDRRRTGAWNTAARYTLNDPNGATQATLLGDVTGPGDNAWIALYDSRVPQFRTSTTATVNPAAANITLAVPAGTANSDLLIAVISRDGGAGTITAPVGWNLINESACSGSVCRLGVFWRLAASEPPSYVFPLGASQEAVGTMLRYTGVDTTTPIDTNIASAPGNNTTPTAPTVNTTVANTRVIRAIAADNNDLAANPYPRDHTGRFGQVTGTFVSGAVADELQGASGATGAAAFALTTARAWRALTFALRPAATAPAPDAGHWEVLVDLSSAVTTGDDLNAFGLRAHDGDATSSGTELNVYYDSHTEYGVNDSPATAPRNYDVFPYVTSGCSSSNNTWDFDAGGSVSAITFSSRTAGFTQTFTDAQLSPNNTWVPNALTGWTTDSSSIEYGIWNLDLDLSQTAGGANYGLIWLGNFLATSSTPGANPTPNAFRVYLPTDGGVAPVKPYLEQLLTYVSGAQTPTVGQTTVLSVTVRVVNPTNLAIVFSAANPVTANVPGPATDVTYQGNAQISQGSLTGEPSLGGIGNVTWDPGTLAAGATGLLAYRVAITPTASPQRIPVTGVVSTGTGANGTSARYVDETGNTTQGRATYTLGPVCELAASVNVLTAAVVSSVRAKDSGRGVIVEWDTVSEVGTVGFDLLRWDRDSAQYVKVNDKLLMGLVASPQGGRYRFVDPGASRFGTHTYVLSEVEASGSRRYHGPFQAKVEGATSPRDTAISADGYERAPRRTTAVFGRILQTRRQELAGMAAAQARTTGPAMKIGVEVPGVYRVPAASIAATLGLPLSRVQSLIASHRFALSHRGRPVAWMPALSDGLLFYGEGIDSIYTRDNVYWLRQGSGLRMGSVVGGTPSPAPEQSFLDARHTEQDRLAATIVSSDPESDYWYWDYLSGGDPTHGRKSFPVLAPSLASGGGAASLRVGLHGATSTGVANEHHVVMRLNGVSVGEARWQGITPQTIDVSIGSSLLQEGENTVEVEALLESGVPWSIVYVDAIDLSYPRRYQAEADALAFRGDGHAVVTVDSFSDGRIVVLDLTDPLRPKRVVRVTTDMRPQGNFLVSFIPSSPETPYVAVAPPGWRSPKWVKADLPSRLKARNQGADHVIVTRQELLAPAHRLETLREGQGLRSIVVDLQDVMDEFGDGIDSPHAIKAFLAYARQSWSPAPRFVLLAGTGSFDYKDNLGLGGNLVPPLMAGTPSGLFASDNRFVDLEGDDLVPEIAIGRVPVLTAAELDAYVSKIQAYEASDGAGWKQRALWVADNPEGAANFPADATRVAANLLPGYAPEAIYLAEGTIMASRTQLLNGLANGASLLNYVGHGGLDRLAAEGLLVTADAEALANGERLPVLTALTCIINRFEVPGFVPLGAALVKNGAGGASAVWAPTGLSKNAEAIVLGARFYSEHSSAPDERVGEIVRRSLEAYAGADRERSLLNVYNLFGDPALLFKPPDQAPGGGGDILPSGRSQRE